jgi:site-specific DNA recombinase
MGEIMTTAAIYARVSGARQKEEQTIGSQTAECQQAAQQWGLDVPPEWVFTDEGYTGATLVRPALERLRDLAAQVPVDVVVCYSPDRLARKLAYQTLLIDELNKAGSEVRFVKARKVETPEDEMLLQFQGMMAEYERALIIERTRRGKAFRARSGMVNVLCGAPYGFRYIRRTEVCEARYEIVEEEAQVVREVFRRYTDEQASIGELARWLSAEGVPTRTGKDRWDRSVIWAMLRNPAYVGRAAYLKTGTTDRRPAINRQARLQGRSISRHYAKFERPQKERITIAVPAIIEQEASNWLNVAWPTTAGSRPATAKNRACSWALPPASPAGMRTTGPPPGRPSARSTTTAASVQTTTATPEEGSVTTSQCAPTTSTRSCGPTSPPCWPTPLSCKPSSTAG